MQLLKCSSAEDFATREFINQKMKDSDHEKTTILRIFGFLLLK